MLCCRNWQTLAKAFSYMFVSKVYSFCHLLSFIQFYVRLKLRERLNSPLIWICVQLFIGVEGENCDISLESHLISRYISDIIIGLKIWDMSCNHKNRHSLYLKSNSSCLIYIEVFLNLHYIRLETISKEIKSKGLNKFWQ